MARNRTIVIHANQVVNDFLGTRCENCYSRPQSDRNNTHRVRKKACITIHRVAYNIFPIKPTQNFLFVTEMPSLSEMCGLRRMATGLMVFPHTFIK